jgi:hypothetical protein
VSGELYVSAGFIRAGDKLPRVRVTRADSGDRVHIEIGDLALLVPNDTARELAAAIVERLGEPS